MSSLQEKRKRQAEAERQRMDAEKLRLDADRLRLDTEKLRLDREKFTVDILTKEYQNRFSEVVFHSGRYHKQVNFIQLYLTVLGSFFAILFSKDWSATLGAYPNINILYVQSGLILGAYLISLYLFTNVMDSLYAIYMNGRRLSSIEQQVNSTVGSSILVWDSEIIPRLYDQKKFFIGLWARPNMILGLWSFLFFIGVTAALCGIAYYIANGFFYYFAPPAIFVCCMLVINWFLLHSDGLTFIDAAVTRTAFSASTKFSAPTIALANLLLAYAPMALFSVRDNAFCGGTYTFTFCSIPSVWFGDLILIPIFDYLAITWFFSLRKSLTGTRLVIASSALIAVLVTASLHWIWIYDPWTGFMDLAPGELSSAGWVHFAYTLIQLFIVFTIFGFFVVNREKHRTVEFLDRSGLRFRIAVSVLTVFTALGVCDWYIRNIKIFSRTYESALRNDWIALIPFLAMLCFSAYAFERTRRA